ncbi:hypothetical protein RG959_18165 [Domibacillus sp. 8LH]
MDTKSSKHRSAAGSGADHQPNGVSPKMAFYFNRTMNDIADMQFYSSLQVALGSIKRNRPGRM